MFWAMSPSRTLVMRSPRRSTTLTCGKLYSPGNVRSPRCSVCSSPAGTSSTSARTGGSISSRCAMTDSARRFPFPDERGSRMSSRMGRLNTCPSEPSAPRTRPSSRIPPGDEPSTDFCSRSTSPASPRSTRRTRSMRPLSCASCQRRSCFHRLA